MLQFGMHAPNYRFWDMEEMMEVSQGGATTWLHTSILHDADGRAWFERCLDRPGVIHIRLYTPDWTQEDPGAWAEECAEALGTYLTRPGVIVTPCNEPNLEPSLDSSVARYEAIRDWVLEFAAEWYSHTYDTPVQLYFPPLAYGHEPPEYPPDGEYRILAPAVEVCQGVAVHAAWWPDGNGLIRDGYWHAYRFLRPAGGDDPGGVLAQFGMRVMVTEVTNHAHEDASLAEVTFGQYKLYLDTLRRYPRVIGVTPFIWMSGDEHQGHRIRNNPELVRLLKQL